MDRLKSWAEGNILKFNNRKCQVLLLGRNNPVQQYMLGTNRMKSSFAEKDLGVVVHNKLTMSQHCTLLAKKVNSILGCMRKSVARRLRGVILLYSAPIWCTVSGAGLPSTRKMRAYWSKCSPAPQMMKGVELLLP